MTAPIRRGPIRCGSCTDGLGPRTDRPARVAVIGAGMAGLVAASELRRAGHEPIVLEGQQRVGGRILTLREPFAPGLWARGRRHAHPALARAHPRAHRPLRPRHPTRSRWTTPRRTATSAGRRLRHRELADDPRVLGFETTRHECVRARRSCGPPRSSRSSAASPTTVTTRGSRSPRSTTSTACASTSTVRLVGGRDRDVRAPVQPGSAHELVVPRAAARGARRLLQRPRVHRRRHRPAPARVPAGARAAPPLRRQDGGDRPDRRRGVRALSQRGQPVHGGSRLRGDDRAVPGAAPRRGAHAVLPRQAARHPPAPLRRVGQGVPAVPAPVLGERRRHRRRRLGHRPRGAQRLLPRPRALDRARRAARQLHVGRGRAALGIAVPRRSHRAGARGRRPHPPAGGRRVRGGRVEDVARRRVRRRRLRAVRSRAADAPLRRHRRARGAHPLRGRARVAGPRVDPGCDRVGPARGRRDPRAAGAAQLSR